MGGFCIPLCWVQAFQIFQADNFQCVEESLQRPLHRDVSTQGEGGNPDTSTAPLHMVCTVRNGHGGGRSRKINAWHLYTLMVYL